jgi:hypothetical protein
MAARLAERNRTEFYTLLHKHGLEPEHFRYRSRNESSEAANLIES